MKIVLEFTKTGDLIYISHLDLARLFLRVLRMTGLRPAYSHGFNPHPKMSFALPLGLGQHSTCELLEFEPEHTEALKGSPSVVASQAIAVLNARLPDGVRVNEWYEKPGSITKSMASYVAAANYEFICDEIDGAPALLSAFFAQKNVTIFKRDKKTGADKPKEIRSEMLDYRIIKDLRGRMLAEVTLAAAPGKTLNPQLFFKAFCEASGLAEKALIPVITRTAILGANRVPLRNILDTNW